MYRFFLSFSLSHIFGFSEDFYFIFIFISVVIIYLFLCLILWHREIEIEKERVSFMCFWHISIRWECFVVVVLCFFFVLCYSIMMKANNVIIMYILDWILFKIKNNLIHRTFRFSFLLLLLFKPQFTKYLFQNQNWLYLLVGNFTSKIRLKVQNWCKIIRQRKFQVFFINHFIIWKVNIRNFLDFPVNK